MISAITVELEGFGVCVPFRSCVECWFSLAGYSYVGNGRGHLGRGWPAQRRPLMDIASQALAQPTDTSRTALAVY